MKRSKKLLLVSHCVLNQNAVLKDWERARGSFQFVSEVIKSGVALIQMPCPELIYGGLSRLPMTYEEYNTPEYRALCKKEALTVIRQVEIYVKEGYEIYGVLGIEESPTCSISNQRGVFMEELFEMLAARNITCNTVEIPESWTSEERREEELKGRLFHE